ELHCISMPATPMITFPETGQKMKQAPVAGLTGVFPVGALTLLFLFHARRVIPTRGVIFFPPPSPARRVHTIMATPPPAEGSAPPNTSRFILFQITAWAKSGCALLPNPSERIQACF